MVVALERGNEAGDSRSSSTRGGESLLSETESRNEEMAKSQRNEPGEIGKEREHDEERRIIQRTGFGKGQSRLRYNFTHWFCNAHTAKMNSILTDNDDSENKYASNF